MEKLHAQMQELKENNSIDTIDIESEYNSTEESISLENSTPKRLKLEEKNLVLTSKFSKSKQLRVDVAFAHQKSYQDGGTKAGEVTNRLLFMLAKDKMPYSTVTNKGFQTFIKYVAPLYKIPDRKTITNLIENKYKVLSHSIQQELSEVSNISLTTDVWTDPLNNLSYLGVTCHYISNYEHKSINIGITELSDHHTSVYLKDWLLEIVQNWKIKKENIIAIISDNAANIKKAIVDGFGTEKHLPCLAL